MSSSGIPTRSWLRGVLAVGNGRIDVGVREERGVCWREVGATAAETVVWGT